MRIGIVVALLVLALGGAWWLAQSDDAPTPPAAADRAPSAERPSGEATAELPRREAAATPSNEQPFRERLRTFLRTAPELADAARRAEAEALRRDTLAREADGTLVPAESAYIQLALLRATITDDARLRQRSAELLARYESASEQGWEEFRQRADPRHEAYREAEAELVRRAREEGMTGDELRERLQALREQHYD